MLFNKIFFVQKNVHKIYYNKTKGGKNMKYSSINVNFKDEIKELRTKLTNLGAKNINIKKSYSDYEVTFSIKCVDNKSEITKIIESAGVKNVRANDSYNGARFEYAIDDKTDEKEVKKLIGDMLRRKNYRSN